MTKVDLMIEVWEALDCESVGRAELERVQKELIETLGEGAVESPASIARTLADEGAVLRHPEVLKCDFDWRERRLGANQSDAQLDFSSLAAAISSFAEVEQRRLDATDNSEEHVRLRKILTDARQETQLAAQSRLLSIEQRNEAREISEWIAVWLRSPQLFADWLDLRMRSAQFRKTFSERSTNSH